MRYTFEVEVEVERVEGRFASRDDIGELLRDALEDANPSSVDPGDSSYDVTEWDVAEQPQPKRRTRTAAHREAALSDRSAP